MNEVKTSCASSGIQTYYVENVYIFDGDGNVISDPFTIKYYIISTLEQLSKADARTMIMVFIENEIPLKNLKKKKHYIIKTLKYPIIGANNMPIPSGRFTQPVSLVDDEKFFMGFIYCAESNKDQEEIIIACTIDDDDVRGELRISPFNFMYIGARNLGNINLPQNNQAS